MRKTTIIFRMKIILSALAWLSLLPSHALADVRADAWGIAVQNLFFNTAELDSGRRYLLAGSNQYRTLWARDFSTSVPGALIGGAQLAVKDSLERLFKFQRPDGVIPRTIDNVSITERVGLGLAGMPPEFKEPLKPWFETEYKVVTIDASILVPWAASHYVKKTRDLTFARRHLAQAEKALGYIEANHLVEGLVDKQPPFSDWADSIRREGKVAPTNVYYILALKGLANWSRLLKLEDKAKTYEARATAATQRFNEHFWLEDKKHILNFDGNSVIAADANLLPIVHGIVSVERARQILDTLRKTPLWSPMPGRAAWPDYDSSLKGSNLKWAGIPDYFDGMHWIWITTLAARAEAAVGNHDAALKLMHQLAQRISADGAIHEVYTPDSKGRLKPVRRAIYKAEEPFTWSSAMYLEAAAELKF